MPLNHIHNNNNKIKNYFMKMIQTVKDKMKNAFKEDKKKKNNWKK